jgi:hypothetical protein
VASEADWSGRGPYGLPFFRDGAAEIRPGIVLMPAGGSDFWTGMARDLREASPRGYARLRAAYPGGADGVDLQPASLTTLEVLPTAGAGSRRLAARMRAEGYSTLEELQAHYAGGNDPMDPLNYVWYQYRWQRLAARMFTADGEASLVRFWNCFHAADRVDPSTATAASLAPLLTAEVSPVLGRAVRDWR